MKNFPLLSINYQTAILKLNAHVVVKYGATWRLNCLTTAGSICSDIGTLKGLAGNIFKYLARLIGNLKREIIIFVRQVIGAKLENFLIVSVNY